MTKEEVIEICEKYFPRIGWYSTGESYFGGEDGLDQLEFKGPKLIRFGYHKKLDYTVATKNEVIGWLKEVGMTGIDSLDGVNGFSDSPDTNPDIKKGYEIMAMYQLYSSPYKSVKFNEQEDYRIWIEGGEIKRIENLIKE